MFTKFLLLATLLAAISTALPTAQGEAVPATALPPELADPSLGIPADGWYDQYRSSGLLMSRYSTPICTYHDFTVFLADLNKYIFDTEQDVHDADWKWPQGQIYYQSPRSKMSVTLNTVPGAEYPLTLASAQDVIILLTRWSKEDKEARHIPTVHGVKLSKGGFDKVIARGGLDCPPQPWADDGGSAVDMNGIAVA